MPVAAQRTDDPPADDLLHADLPLYIHDDAMWPRDFQDAQGGFGCTSRVAFGTWRYADTGNDTYQSSWWRIANYGVFHCLALVATNAERKDLGKSAPVPAFFILIGKTADRELWVIQKGARPGSDYILLARKPGDGIVKRFDVLQSACPKEMARKSENLDILLTNYCAIESRGDLLALARRMAKLPRLGSLTFVDSDTSDAE